MTSSDQEAQSLQDVSPGQDPDPKVSSLPRIATNEIRLGTPMEFNEPSQTLTSAWPLADASVPEEIENSTVTSADAADPNARTGQVVTEHGLTVVPTRANPVARRLLAKMWVSDAPPTQALPVVERLRGTPYANPRVTSDTDQLARPVLEFALDLAETLFRYGAGALEAETSVIAVTAALGLKNVDVDVTNQSIHLNYIPREGEGHSVLRVVRSSTANFAGLALVHQLVSDIISGGVSATQASARLQAIMRKPRPFPRWFVATARGIFAAAFVLFIGGSALGALIAFGSSWLVSQVMKFGGRWSVPEFFTVAASTCVVTAVALIGFAAQVPIDPALVVAGGILLLLPSVRFVSALQDAINGFPVTAVGRIFSAGLVYVAILSGISVALVASVLLGSAQVTVQEIQQVSYPQWFMLILVAVAIAAGAVSEQTAKRLVLPTVGIAVIGYLVMLGCQMLGLGERATPAVVATVIGFAARFTAEKFRAPQLVIASPAVYFMLPGLMVFRSMYGIVLETETMAMALVEMFNAFAIMFSIAGGVVFGDTLCRPLIAGARRERKRIRRR
ncbi:threonine/serine ThrE exporter family protein [Glutamicibacter uratoxydans]|uniref:threonine/serine ThrE exporter family protein n=1 Tax=Glutamicibacter uratoxydans TaxID=43667 RepID=UPI003D6F61CC